MAGAVQYVSDALKPSPDNQGEGAESDPEVQDFRNAAAEATQGVKQAVEPTEASGSAVGSEQKSVSEQASSLAHLTFCTGAVCHG